MQIVSENYKNKINNTLALSPYSKVVVDGVEYLGDVIKASPKFKHSNDKFIGGFPIKTLDFEIYDFNNNLDFENKEITVYKGLKIGDEIEWVKQGVFIPKKDNIETNISTRSIIFKDVGDRAQFLDDVYKSDLDWSVKHSGLEIIEEICIKKNIILKTKNFAFANYLFKQPNFKNDITNREVISRMGEIGGEISLFNNDGNLEIKSQFIINDTILRSRYAKLSREKEFKPNVLVLGNENYENNIVYPEIKPANPVEVKINDNPFVDINKKEMVEEVASHVLNVSYIPFQMDEFVDGFIYELNDVIKIIDKNGEVFNAVILDISSSSRIKSNVKANVYEESKTDYNLAGSNKISLKNVEFKVNYIDNTIKALATEVGSNSEKTSSLELDVENIIQTISNFTNQSETIAKIQLTIEEIKQSISDSTDTTVSSSGVGTINILNALMSEILFLQVYPTKTDLSYLYLSENHLDEEDYLLSRKLIFKYVGEEEGIEDEIFSLPCDLLYLNANIYDEFILDFDNQEMYVIHRVGLNNTGEKYALDEPVTEYFVYTPIILNGDYNIQMLSFNDAYINIRALAKNIYTSQYATRVEMNSAITTTKESIMLDVNKTLNLINDEVEELSSKLTLTTEEFSTEISKKVGNNEIISKINQSVEGVTINANKIGLTANNILNLIAGNELNLTSKNISIKSNNFSVTSAGALTASSATLNNVTINGGQIKLNNGASVVGSNGLLTNLIFPGFVRGQTVMGSGDYLPIGHVGGGNNATTQNNAMVFMFKLPANFTIKSAKVYLTHAPINWTTLDGSYTGYCRNLNLYKITSSTVNLDMANYYGIYSSSYSLISGALNFTGSKTSVTTVVSADIKSSISTTSYNQIAVRTSAAAQTGDKNKFERTGGVVGYLEVIGYTNWT